MFRARFWIARVGISVALIAAVCAGSVILPHAEGLDDPACAPVLVTHDESAHYIGAAPSLHDADGQHCYLCHAARSWFSLFERDEHRERPVRAERLYSAPLSPAERLEWALLPGRAPPV